MILRPSRNAEATRTRWRSSQSRCRQRGQEPEREISRRFVEGTRRRLVKLQRRDLSKLSLAVLMIDGIHFEDHVVLVALGFENDGKKHVLGLW